MVANNIISEVISVLKSDGFSNFNVFSTYSRDISEKPRRSTFVSVGIKELKVGETVSSPNLNFNGKRKCIADIKITFYSDYSKGSENCMRLFDLAVEALLSSDLKNFITEYKCESVVYRRDIDSIVLESILTLDNIYS